MIKIEIEQTDLEKIFGRFLKPIPAAVMARLTYEMMYEAGEQIKVSNFQVIEYLSKALPQIEELKETGRQ